MDEHTFALMVLVGCVFSNCMAHKSFRMCLSYVPGNKQVRAPSCEALNITKETSCIAISFNGSHGLEGKYLMYTHTHTHTTRFPIQWNSVLAQNNFAKHRIYTDFSSVESDLIISHVSNCGNKILLLTNDEAMNSSAITSDYVFLRILPEVSSVSCYWSQSLSLHNVAHQIIWRQITSNCASASILYILGA